MARFGGVSRTPPLPRPTSSTHLDSPAEATSPLRRDSAAVPRLDVPASPVPPPLVVHERPLSSPDVATLTEQVQAYYVEIYGGPDDTPVDSEEFTRPRGAFFVGYLDDTPVAMGGWRLLDRAVGAARRPAEIKRMYVAPAHRGRGFARTLLAHLEESARQAGADGLVLETGEVQPDAIALYRSSGYVDVPRFGYYACAPKAVHLGKILSADQP